MRSFLAFLMVLFSLNTFAQEVVVDEDGFKTFTLVEGDTAFTMRQYFLVFLKEGKDRSQSPDEVEKIQVEHLAHINWMAEQGYICMAGPFGEGGDPTEIRGILVFNVPSEERARELANMDPAVKAGRLSVEIHPWWSARGSQLP